MGATRNNQRLEAIAKFVNPYVRGWVNYYGRFYKSALTPVLRGLDRSLVYWPIFDSCVTKLPVSKFFSAGFCRKSFGDGARILGNRRMAM